jgi:hypothetical protein
MVCKQSFPRARSADLIPYFYFLPERIDSCQKGSSAGSAHRECVGAGEESTPLSQGVHLWHEIPV